jgi:hypothetical protein
VAIANGASIRLSIIDHALQTGHSLHGESRIWAETNCYVDLWIELLHGIGLDPVAALGFALGIEFEGDQWTFIKYPLADLKRAYGLDVIELALWRSLEAHLIEQLAADRVVIVEVDAFHLPDTRATSYRSSHVKTSIAVTGIDVDAKRLEYFHGPGHFVVDGADYDSLLRLGDPGRFTGDVLPPYVEVVKQDRQFVRDQVQVANIAAELARVHLADRRPAKKSAEAFRNRITQDAPSLLGDLGTFHAYAFATVRQLGAASELASDLFGLLDVEVASQFVVAAQGCKSMQFKLARMAAGRAIDLDAAVDAAINPWLTAMDSAQEFLRVKP